MRRKPEPQATAFAPQAGYTQGSTGRGGKEMYLDLYMLLNFGVDYLLLLGTQKLSGTA